MTPPPRRDFGRFGKRRPVRGGIEARSRRGVFGGTWWGRNLVESVERLADAGRMSRARTYARAGQVVDMHLQRGEVRAEVQGSQPDPFESVFCLRVFDADRTAELVDTIRATPGMLAEIVSGSLPEELGPLLLPQTASELDFDCTCPDPGWPCKHVAAVALLTAEEIDERPLGILTLRGVELDTLISGVERRSAEAADDTVDVYGDSIALPDLPTVEFRPAPEDLDPLLLRRALRETSSVEGEVAAGLRDLTAAYRRLAD